MLVACCVLFCFVDSRVRKIKKKGLQSPGNLLQNLTLLPCREPPQCDCQNVAISVLTKNAPLLSFLNLDRDSQVGGHQAFRRYRDLHW